MTAKYRLLLPAALLSLALAGCSSTVRTDANVLDTTEGTPVALRNFRSSGLKNS